MISVKRVRKKEERILQNLMQKYLYEMSQYFDDLMDADGNYPYRYLPLYFIDADRCAYFIYDNSDLIGFALINSCSLTNERISNCIAEFTIFPVHRHKGKGLEAVAALKEERSGKWQLKYSVRNTPARRFWNTVRERYSGVILPLSESERIIEFE